MYAGGGRIDVNVIDDEHDLTPLWQSWDDLATISSQPYCTPAWMIAWWRHARPRGAKLRTIVVHQGDRLIGIAPFFTHRTVAGITRYRLLGARCSARVDLLALPGREAAVARALAGCVDRIQPRPGSILFEGVRESSPWPELLSSARSRKHPLRLASELAVDAPFVVTAEGGFEEWFAAKSKNFRQSLRRKRRHLEREGATFGRVTTEDGLERALHDLARLHRLRWDERGGSGVLVHGVERMLRDAGHDLLGLGRFDIWWIEVHGRCISSHLFLTAGSETTYWLGGFDPAWARYQPSMLALVEAIQHAFDARLARVDLGTGAQPYKLRFTDEVESVRFINAIPRGSMSALARADLLPWRARLAAAERLSPKAKRRIRGVVSRVHSFLPEAPHARPEGTDAPS
jgi:CelD/BcsL family acetyltransferase involved in cellulose biosynthesis